MLHRYRVLEALGVRALGNHEFDGGVSGLLDPLLKNASFTILSANIKGKTPLANEMMKYVNPFTIVHFDSESVGIVGYTTKETSFLSQPGDDVIFEDEIEALQVQVNKLTAMGVNKIIALGHSGFTVDKNIAQKVKGVDVVIGGHTNTFLYTEIDIIPEINIVDLISSAAMLLWAEPAISSFSTAAAFPVP
ncbi:PREDICTED: 5'-nucleotidase-like, partial [Leptosomus discolor]|uniref:5'-nucleotidase-like n=1 Tax=Leptosomus discolor TaxID=188344 RepID=UPI000522BB0F